MPLRKVHLHSQSLAANAASFTNVTARRLHILIIDQQAFPSSTALALGDAAVASIDEIPVNQINSSDSRSHISGVSVSVPGGTGAIEGIYTRSVTVLNRGDLVLDPDESLFMNTLDKIGAPVVEWTCNFWYDD